MSKNLSKFELEVSRFRQIGNDSTHIGYNFGTKAMILSKKSIVGVRMSRYF